MSAFGEEPSLQVTVNRSQIYIGESVLVDVRIGNATGTEPDMRAVAGCVLRPLGSQDASQYSVSFVNGRLQRVGYSSRVYRYEATPNQSGQFIPGPVRVTLADGRVLTGSAPPVTVTGMEQQSWVSLRLTTSRNAVMVNEPFDLRLTIRIHRLTGALAGADPLYPDAAPLLNLPYLSGDEIDGLKAPDVNAWLNSHLLADQRQPGFALNSFTVQAGLPDPSDFDSFFRNGGPFQPRQAKFRLDREWGTSDGMEYAEYTIVLSYEPLKEGDYTFGPVIFKGPVPVNSPQAANPQRHDVFAVGPAVTVRVIPPPEDTRPDSYIGAIGSNLTATAALDTQTCNVGDPLQLTLTVGGGVQLRNIFPPPLDLQSNLVEHFEIYRDSVQTVKRDDARAYRYTIRPRAAGSYELPAIAVSYYDVGSRAYRTVTTAPLPIKVRRTTEVTAEQIVASTNPVLRDTELPDARPLAPAAMRLDHRGAEPASLTGSAWLAAVGAVGPAVYGLAMLAGFVRRRRPDWARARRRRRALRHGQRALLQIRAATPAAYCAILRTFLAERWNLSAASLTPDETRDALLNCGVAHAAADELVRELRRHFEASFSGNTDSFDAQTRKQLYEAMRAANRAEGQR
ncbi:MAG: BatD family protein [bacterium]